ncbi:hypothetical protein K523DRAFT_319531 [Schizophyllum commune Tattone D]|nr:hypothetical protein K523DRAFT_319531 [Schizophyllum commune Tattone D]
MTRSVTCALLAPRLVNRLARLALWLASVRATARLDCAYRVSPRLCAPRLASTVPRSR